MARLCQLWAQLFGTTCLSMCTSPCGPHSAISSQHTDPLSPMKPAATCSPCLKSHFTALSTLREIKITSTSSYLQHPCPSGQQLQATPGEMGTHHVSRELAHRSPVLSTCVELEAVGDSVQGLRTSGACARGKTSGQG